MNVNRESRPRKVSFALGATVGAAFILWPLWVGFVIAAVALLIFAVWWRHKTDIVISLLFAAGIFVGMAGTVTVVLVSVFTYCSHHMGSDECA
jgi:hypothetical protein